MTFMCYLCRHPLYDDATLYFQEDLEDLKGLCVVQKRFDPINKIYWFGSIDHEIANNILNNDLFEDYFKKHATLPENGLYPTFNVRKVMWALKMRPMKLQDWEKEF